MPPLKKKKKLPKGFEWTRRHSDIKGWIDELICPHGIGHDRGVHGCDGCCSEVFAPKKNLRQEIKGLLEYATTSGENLDYAVNSILDLIDGLHEEDIKVIEMMLVGERAEYIEFGLQRTEGRIDALSSMIDYKKGLIKK